MNSLFLRLYLLIVATVLIIGISLDFAWQYFDNEPLQNDDKQAIISVTSVQLDTLREEQLEQHLKILNRELKNHLSLINIDTPIGKSLSFELNSEKTTFVENENEVIGFKKLKKHPYILQYTFAHKNQYSLAKPLFIGLFYSLIAVVIFYWIWPLSKDLNQLEKSVNQFDQQEWQSSVDLPATSSIYHLAKAYNSLLDRIRLLVETQQAMSHSISHELRTPLARIRFALQMAQESPDINQIKQQLNSIDGDILEMRELIDELLSFASLEKISVVAQIEKGEINLLIENLLNKLKQNYPDKQIKFSNNQKAQLVACDSYLIERAIQNLVVNACKFSKNKVKVSFQTDSHFYQIIVEDDGTGIDEKQRAKVFDSFVQLENSNKNKGFGLGLAIVKRVMVLHKGTAEISDSKLGGAKFILSWPMPK